MSESVAKTLAALGSATRLALVQRLALDETFTGPSISELAAGSGKRPGRSYGP